MGQENGTAKTITLGEYLFARLRQLGVASVHGVPGDYNLELLDYVEPAGLLWVGNANELNAGYAADGYARIKGVGALVTTYGVGELSAINAIAGAYTERAAVVHIVGTPARNLQEGRKNVHHTLGDGDYGHFSHMAAHVTVAQVDLVDARTAPKLIDHALEQCILHSRPVYIQVPTDMVPAPVSSGRLDSEIQISQALPTSSHDAVVAQVMEKLYAAKQPVVLVDGETRALGVSNEVEQLIRSTKLPTLTTSFGTGLIDMTLPNVYGIFEGSFADPKTKSLIDDSDLVLLFGPHLSSTNSYAFSAIPKPEITISFTSNGISIGNELSRDVSVKQTLSQILKTLDPTKVKEYATGLDLPRPVNLPFSAVPDDEIIRQDKIWKVLGSFMRPGDIILGETGTAGYGVREMAFPAHSRLFTPVTWLSIGYMLPATQGAALAQRELIASSKYHDIKEARTILLIGDGSFQMTVQELSTIIRHQLNVVIILINNDGYTIERVIHGLKQSYNDIAPWKYLKAPALFGAPENTYTGSAKTYGELKQVLQDKDLADGKGLRMVEVFMGREDAPAGPLMNLLNRQLGTASRT